ncbi:MAG: class I SAM-dependent methyltransferase [Planctomycetes bacterium]|nr:class I SAM-dependent methyltransferase [Planctomycetota bacterium]
MGQERLSWFGRLMQRLHPEGIPAGAAKVYNALSGTSIFLRHYDLVAEDVVKFCSAGRLLDIGTGPGRLLIPMYRQAPQLELTGVDISEAMVVEAAKNIAAAGMSDGIRVRQAGAKQLPFEDNYFDIVISSASLHHWKEPKECMAEIRRVLKPGGAALLYDLVKNMPKEILAEGRRKYGGYRMFLLWLHSFEEPFYNPESMVSLADPKLFETIHTRWVGLLCCLTLRKPIVV